MFAFRLCLFLHVRILGPEMNDERFQKKKKKQNEKNLHRICAFPNDNYFTKRPKRTNEWQKQKKNTNLFLNNDKKQAGPAGFLKSLF